MRSILIALMLLALAPRPGAAAEIEFTPQAAEETTLTIQQAGFDCPRAKLGSADGTNDNGIVLRVYCGPASGNGVYRDRMFRLIPMPDGNLRVEQWGG